MGLADWLKRAFAPVRPSDPASLGAFGIAAPVAGLPVVTESSALNIATVYACARAISDAMAAMPLILYRSDGKTKTRANQHPAYAVLKEQANPLMTAFEYRQTKYLHLCLWGNHYAEKVFDDRGRVVALYPIPPSRVTVRYEGGELLYDVLMANGQSVRFQAWKIHHVKGMSNDGFVGMSPIRLAANSLGFTQAADEYGAQFFASGGRPKAILKASTELTPEAIQRLETAWGRDSGNKTRILEQGWSYESIGINPNDAQFLETRAFQRNEIARWFRVPPAIIGDLEHATYANAEQQALDFVTNCLRPWASNDEQALRRDVLTGSDRQTYDVEYLFDDLLRGDTATRFESYRTAINNGIMSPNEARAKENLPPIEYGDNYYMPLQTGRIGEDGALLAPVSAGEMRALPAPVVEGEYRVVPSVGQEQRTDRAIEQRARVADGYADAIAEVLGRTVKKEARDIRKQIDMLHRGDVEGFLTWLRSYVEELSPFIVRSLTPVLRTLMLAVVGSVAQELDKDDTGLTDAFRAWVDGYALRYGQEYGDESYAQLRALIEEMASIGGDIPEAVETRLTEWDERRAEKEARSESVNVVGAMAIAAYQAYNVQRITWRANAGACPICRQMDGRTVQITESFARKGDELAAEGQDTITVSRDRKHPPLHGGCTCGIGAAQ